MTARGSASLLTRTHVLCYTICMVTDSPTNCLGCATARAAACFPLLSSYCRTVVLSYCHIVNWGSSSDRVSRSPARRTARLHELHGECDAEQRPQRRLPPTRAAPGQARAEQRHARRKGLREDRQAPERAPTLAPPRPLPRVVVPRGPPARIAGPGQRDAQPQDPQRVARHVRPIDHPRPRPSSAFRSRLRTTQTGSSTPVPPLYPRRRRLATRRALLNVLRPAERDSPRRTQRTRRTTDLNRSVPSAFLPVLCGEPFSLP